MKDLRITSFLPAATEMIYALGLGENLVGRSHECLYPPEAKAKPEVVRCAMDLASLNLAEIDAAVSARVAQGQSVYAVDEAELRAAAPTLIVTQELCHVCAPSGNEITQALSQLSPKPEILWQTPHSFEDVLAAVLTLGEKTGTSDRARAVTAAARAKVDAVAARSAALPKPRVFFMEWVDPVYCGGHWIPSMLDWAGGRDAISRPGVDSVRTAWDAVRDWNPEVLFVAPCGYDSAEALRQARSLEDRPDWASLAAVKQGRVFALDASSYFARPGLRLADGVELLAHLIHPDHFSWSGSADAFRRI